MDAIGGTLTERRLATRVLTSEGGMLRARVRPGHEALVRDVSANGLLIETGRRLLPGTVVDVTIERADRIEVLRARVSRCAVTTVTAESVRYLAGLAIELAGVRNVAGPSFPLDGALNTHASAGVSRVLERHDDIA